MDTKRKEKRKSSRIQKVNKLTLEVISQDSCIEYDKIPFTLTSNISLDGISLQTDTFLPSGTLVEIELALSKINKIIKVKAVIKRVKSLYDDEVFEMGLEFIDTQPEVISSLIGYLYGK